MNYTYQVGKHSKHCYSQAVSKVLRNWEDPNELCLRIQHGGDPWWDLEGRTGGNWGVRAVRGGTPSRGTVEANALSNSWQRLPGLINNRVSKRQDCSREAGRVWVTARLGGGQLQICRPSSSKSSFYPIEIMEELLCVKRGASDMMSFFCSRRSF